MFHPEQTHTHTNATTLCSHTLTVLSLSTGLVSADADVALPNPAAPIKKITKDKGWTSHTHTHTHLPTHTLTERYIYTSEYFAGRQHTLRREDNPLHRLNLNLQPFLFDNWQIGRHLGGLSSSTVFIWTHTHTLTQRKHTAETTARTHKHRNRSVRMFCPPVLITCLWAINQRSEGGWGR